MCSSRFALLLGMLVLVPTASPAWANPFVEFFRQQKIGQEIKVQGPFRRNPQQMKVFKKDYKTGEIEYYTFFATVILSTHLIGNGSLTQEARGMDTLVVFYPDENMVKDLPVEGDEVWFTGTLLGYQFGDSIITDVGTGGYPYILLKSIEPVRPQNPAPPP